MQRNTKVKIALVALPFVIIGGFIFRDIGVSQGYLLPACKEDVSPQAGEGILRFVWEGTTEPVACEPVQIIIADPEDECYSSPCPSKTITVHQGKTSKQGAVIIPASAMEHKGEPLVESLASYNHVWFTRTPRVGELPLFELRGSQEDMEKILKGEQTIPVQRLIDVRKPDFELRINETALLANPGGEFKRHTVHLVKNSSGQLVLETGSSQVLTVGAVFALPFDRTRSTLSVQAIHDDRVTFQIHKDAASAAVSDQSAALATQLKELNERCSASLTEAELRSRVEEFTKWPANDYVLFAGKNGAEQNMVRPMPCRAFFYASRVISLEKNLCQMLYITVDADDSHVRGYYSRGNANLERTDCSFFLPPAPQDYNELLPNGDF